MNSTASIATIYDLLAEGKTLQFRFVTNEERDAFKIRLHQYRKGVCDMLSALGEKNEKNDELKSLTFTQLETHSEGTLYKVRLDRPLHKYYNFQVVESSSSKDMIGVHLTLNQVQ